MAKTTTRCSAVTDGGYHYPDGFIALGQSADLSEEDAARGLADGRLALTPQAPAKSAPSGSPDPSKEN